MRRALLRRLPFLERRWIPRTADRDAHANLVRRRIHAEPTDADAPADPSGLPTAEGDEPAHS